MSIPVRQVWIEDEGDVADGIFFELTEVDDYTKVEIDIVERVYLEYQSGSLEAEILKKKLSRGQRGKRMLIYKSDDPKRPLIIAEKSNRGEDERR